MKIKDRYSSWKRVSLLPKTRLISLFPVYTTRPHQLHISCFTKGLEMAGIPILFIQCVTIKDPLSLFSKLRKVAYVEASRACLGRVRAAGSRTPRPASFLRTTATSTPPPTHQRRPFTTTLIAGHGSPATRWASQRTL